MPYIIKVIICGRMRWTGLWHLWGEEKMVGKPEGKRQHARAWPRQVYNIKIENAAC
jgi:hypothetical protein